MKRKYRIKSRYRFFFSFMIIMFFLLSIGANVAGSDIYMKEDESSYKIIEIQAGDTLWNIARDFGPEGKDIRRIVHKIIVINDLSPEELRPGQEIVVPAVI